MQVGFSSCKSPNAAVLASQGNWMVKKCARALPRWMVVTSNAEKAISRASYLPDSREYGGLSTLASPLSQQHIEIGSIAHQQMQVAGRATYYPLRRQHR